MRIRLKHLLVRTRQTTERIPFSSTVTFLYGPVGTGKSTIARLVDYCLGGHLERTPAVQQEFVSATLSLELGDFACTLERGADDTQAVRVTWERDESDVGSVSAPLIAGETQLTDAEVFNLSDLLFHLCGVTPIKVRKRTRDPDSPMIRLGFRDVWSYCYLDQTHLDSSFYRLEDPFRGRKSQDAMRFFTGLHSERLSQVETELFRAIDDQQGKREAVRQIRAFMDRFELGSELDLAGQIQKVQEEHREAETRRQELEVERSVRVHPTDELRVQLRTLGEQVASLKEAVLASEESLHEQTALKAELITAKIKADRSEQAGRVLEGVDYAHCPQCGTDISTRAIQDDSCNLCCSPGLAQSPQSSLQLEAFRRELNDRIDQISDSITRRSLALKRSRRQLESLVSEKISMDRQLQEELSRYDSAYVESVRLLDREIATLDERLRSLDRLQEMPRAINELEEKAGELQGKIDLLRSSIEDERRRLRAADDNIRVIADCFKEILLAVGLPGFSDADEIVLDPKNWKPHVVHDGQEWGFWDTGSGGKKTLFNVCYAIALHDAARIQGMPVPTVLIIDSPTKNISDDENPELVAALYREIYRVAAQDDEASTQFLLIDSDLVRPDGDFQMFEQRRIAGEPDAPSLIPYYVGP